MLSCTAVAVTAGAYLIVEGAVDFIIFGSEFLSESVCHLFLFFTYSNFNFLLLTIFKMIDKLNQSSFSKSIKLREITNIASFCE